MMKKELALAIALLLLTACGPAPGAVEPSAPPPAATPSASPSPTPEPRPAPTTEPTPAPVVVDLTELLQAAEGQDLDLRAYDVGCTWLELCPGFAEYTGWSGVEDSQVGDLCNYHRKFAGGRCYEVFYSGDSDWDPITVLITDAVSGGAFRQKLTVEGDPYGYARTADFTVEDLNFDGYPDVKLYLAGGRGGERTYTALLWGPESGTYGEERSFTEISAPIRDNDHRLYWGGYDVNWRREEQAYEYLDGRFVCTHALTVDRDAGPRPETARCTEWALENGQLRAVGSLDGAWEAYDLQRLLEAYVEQGTVWPGWAWGSTSLHEMKG